MSSSILNWAAPYHPLFPTDLKVFECTCFVRDVSPQVSKLDLKSLKYIFVGYLVFKTGIGVIVPPFDVTLCLLMLHSLRRPPFSIVISQGERMIY